MPAYLLGLDIGSSSIKGSLLDANSGRLIVSATSPSVEMPIASPNPGWAEQDPESWWEHVIIITRKILATVPDASDNILAMGMSYQMHGLVIVDRDHQPLRPSIIWCDSRAVETGQKAFSELGNDYCLSNYLNSPGNFTIAKLKWVKENEPEVYRRIHKFMLPGDFIAMKLTGEIATTMSGLSEGICWDYKKNTLAESLLEYYQIDKSLVADIAPTFGLQGRVSDDAARTLGIRSGTPVTYRAGDQPNNAFSLNTLNPGEVAATAGTSGVIYGVLDKPVADKLSRINGFLHVNHTAKNNRIGLLLCINGTGIMNSWLRKVISTSSNTISYETINNLAAQSPIGADGLLVFPFGNGAERIFENENIGASFHNLELTRHSTPHLARAVQEGIVFSLAYGFDIFKDLGLEANVIRAGKANMFLSPVFCEAFTNVTGATLELYNTDGAQGAARGAGIGCGFYKTHQEAFKALECIERYTPSAGIQELYKKTFQTWKTELSKILVNKK